jgi:hypothetical protein
MAFTYGRRGVHPGRAYAAVALRERTERADLLLQPLLLLLLLLHAVW